MLLGWCFLNLFIWARILSTAIKKAELNFSQAKHRTIESEFCSINIYVFLSTGSTVPQSCLGHTTTLRPNTFEKINNPTDWSYGVGGFYPQLLAKHINIYGCVSLLFIF